MKDKQPLPVRKEMCSTCPFRPGGWTAVRPLLEERVLHSTPICHSTGKALKLDGGRRMKAHACRGARDVQLKHWHSIGFISAPTDEAWFAKLAEIRGDEA